MKKFCLPILATAAVIISYNCSKSKINPSLGDIKINVPLTHYDYSTVKVPAGTELVKYENSSIVNNYKATIGRVLFYDKALSINNSVSCASCHSQKHAFSDVTSLSTGFQEKKTIRNSMGISNLIDEKNVGYFWDARETKIETMVFAYSESY